MKKLYPWLFALVTIGPAVANEFYAHPWLPYAANLLWLYSACLVAMLVLYPLLIIGPAKVREGLRKEQASLLVGWLTLLTFVVMGWAWLATASILAGVLNYIARHLDDEAPAP